MRRRLRWRRRAVILFVFVLAGCCAMLGAQATGAARTSEAHGPLRLLGAGLIQVGDQLRLRVRSAGSVSDWLHYREATVCVALASERKSPVEVCVGARGSRLDTLDAAGRLRAVRPLASTIATSGTRTVVIGFPMAAVGVRTGPLEWSVRSRWTGAPCSASHPCVSRLPPSGRYSMTVTAPGPVGCVPAGEDLRFSGPEPTDEVSLTFDDGPGPWTPGVLGELERERAPATFFIVGEHIAGNEALLRRMLRDGDAVGNHSYSHSVLARDGAFAHREIAETNTLIWQAAGYEPCLFRAPYGEVSPELIADARSQGLISTGWNVDPRDWSQPGVDAIVSTTLEQTRPGSIILMHDGGGVRRQTLDALPRIISALRARGLRLVTVPELLRLRPRDDRPPTVGFPPTAGRTTARNPAAYPMAGAAPEAHHAPMFPAHAYNIRYATFADEPALRRLMELNRQRVFGGPALIGEIEGAVAAAASLFGGRVLVDPSQDTATLKELLAIRRMALRN